MKYILSALMIAACVWATAISLHAAWYWNSIGNVQSRDLCLILALAMLLGALMFTGVFVVRPSRGSR